MGSSSCCPHSLLALLPGTRPASQCMSAQPSYDGLGVHCHLQSLGHTCPSSVVLRPALFHGTSSSIQAMSKMDFPSFTMILTLASVTEASEILLLNSLCSFKGEESRVESQESLAVSPTYATDQGQGLRGTLIEQVFMMGC